MKVSYRKLFCLPLACLLALTACARGTGANTDAASAEPVPIEVPPPVEQTNEGLSIFYTDAVSIRATILDMAVGQYNREHPDSPVTAEKVFYRQFRYGKRRTDPANARRSHGGRRAGSDLLCRRYNGY